MAKSLNERRSGDIYKRPNFPMEFKRGVVEQTFEPGASVSLIARRSDINTNLLFKWRRQYLAGSFGAPALAVATPASDARSLLPVSIMGSVPGQVALDQECEVEESSAESVCEVEFERARLRIRGNVSSAMVRLLIQELRR